MNTPTPLTVQGIDHINMAVRDLDRAIDFYAATLGFDVREDQRHRADGPYVIMGSGHRVFLALHQEPEMATPERPFIGHWGFVVGDLDEARDRLKALNIAWLYTNHNDGLIVYPHSRSTYIADPDGHEIELVENFGGGL